MNIINIITRCSRPENLSKVKESIYSKSEKFKINWFVVFDTNSLSDINSDLLTELYNNKVIIKFIKSVPGDHGHLMINACLEEIEEGFVYVLDDDNIIHEDFYDTIYQSIEQNSEKRGFIFSQKIGGKDFTGLDIREAKPENTRVQHIDMAQFLLRRDLIGKSRLEPMKYIADGNFIEKLYNENKEDFFFIEKVLCYYNFIEKRKLNSLPRILVVGTNSDVNLNSRFIVDYESTELNTLSVLTDENIDNVIQDFNPDSIITVSDSFANFPKLSHHCLDVRGRWLHFNELEEKTGESSYYCAMNYILNSSNDETPLVSVFTPIYNIGEKLLRTYESMRSQNYTNWEWVLVNDSNDGGKTLRIAEELSKKDSRISVYEFKKKSGGIVGESKYRAATLSRGKYIMELDHDDFLLPEALSLMVKAFKEYPDAKFVYSNCAEIDEQHNSLNYGDNFSFGYGKYKEEYYAGRKYNSVDCANINPKTIRHIVGVPNHFRAWEKSFYLSIGGHNRRLTIVDDYELIVRTFLHTKMVKIPKMLYLQYYHNSNTQNLTRKDIQRRVRTISNHYNESIKNRFIELGLEDWAYNSNPLNPLVVESRFGDDEGFVNYIFEFDKKVEYNFNVLSNSSILSI